MYKNLDAQSPSPVWTSSSHHPPSLPPSRFGLSMHAFGPCKSPPKRWASSPPPVKSTFGSHAWLGVPPRFACFSCLPPVPISCAPRPANHHFPYHHHHQFRAPDEVIAQHRRRARMLWTALHVSIIICERAYDMANFELARTRCIRNRFKKTVDPDATLDHHPPSPLSPSPLRREK